ncbi:MAG: hypothetical protein ABR913_11325 [Sedimentisphaerales bacterium]|jgi:hypothetical protein
MMSIMLLLVVLGMRRIPIVLLNYGYASFGTADLKATGERFAREIMCWN